MLETTTQSPEPCPRCGAAIRPRPNPLLRGRRGWVCGTVDTPDGLAQSHGCEHRERTARASLFIYSTLTVLEAAPPSSQITEALVRLNAVIRELDAAPETMDAVALAAAARLLRDTD